MTPSPRRSTSAALIVALTTILSLSCSSARSSADFRCPAHPEATTMPKRLTPAFTTTLPPRISPRQCGSISGLATCLGAVTPNQAHGVAAKLYPLSTIPIVIQNYLWTRPETCCPRGAAVGSIVQTLAIFMGVPIVAVATKLTMLPFIEIDWLHGIEQMLMAVPVQIMAMSFRQAVLSQEKMRPLPKSATHYAPMMKVALILYSLIFLLASVHKAVGGQNWTSIRFLGGLIDPPGIDVERLRGALSFAVWIPHWTMFIDFGTHLWYMSRWADCTGMRQWKTLSLMQIPYAFVNAIVAMNHVHRDRIPALKLLHPMFVFGGSLTSLLGTTILVVVAARSNGRHGSKPGRKHEDHLTNCLVAESEPGVVPYPDWDLRYTTKSMILALFLSYASVYFTK